MSSVHITSPAQGAPVKTPITVQVSWSIDASTLEAAQKKYEEAKERHAKRLKKYHEELKEYKGDKARVSTAPPSPPPPFLVHLRVQNWGLYYQFEFDANYAGTSWLFNGIPIPATSAQLQLLAELVETRCTDTQTDDVVLNFYSVGVTVTT